MTLSSENNKNSYTANGTNTTFSYTFKVLDLNDLQVYIDDVLQSAYTATGAGNDAGGNVVFSIAPASGEIVTIVRNEPFTQQINYIEGDDFPAEAHEQGLDRSVMRDLTLKEKLDRALILPVSSVASGQLPSPKGGKLLAWNADGSGIEYIESADASANNVTAFGATESRSLAYRFSDIYNARDHSSYNTDPSSAIQAAINKANENGGGTVLVPDGVNPEATLSSGLTLYSNIRMIWRGTFNLSLSSGTSFFSGVGAIGSEINISSNIGRGDNEISTSSSHNLAVGDLVRVLGQRNCLSDDANSSGYRLGYGGSSYCYFGEFATVKEIVDSNTFRISKPLIFPDYNNSDASDSDANKRSATTIQKVSALENVILDFTHAQFKQTGNFQDFIRIQYGRDCKAIGGVYDKAAYDGSVCFFVDSYNCRWISPHIKHDEDANILISSNKDDYNTLKTAGSDYCDFVDIISENGSQVVDYSFFNGGKCSLAGYVSGKCLNSKATMTTHQGVYGGSFNVEITGHQGGLSLRSLDTIVEKISFQGIESSNLGTAGFLRNGLSLYQKWARRCSIGMIRAMGADNAFNIGDASGNSDEKFDKVHSHVSSIVSIDCNYDLILDRSGTYEHDIPSGLSVGSILSVGCKEACVSVQAYFHSVDIGQVIVNDFAGSSKSIFEGDANCTGIRFGAVTLNNCGSTNQVYDFPKVTDTTTITDGNNHHVLPDPFVSGDIGNVWGDTADTVSPYALSTQEALSVAADVPPIARAYVQFGVNTTNKYWGAYNWISNDNSLTNPNQLVAQILARSTQTHNGTNMGTALDFYATANSDGNNPQLCASIGQNNSTDKQAALSIEETLLIRDGVSAPTANNSGYAQIYIDSTDGNLKIRFGDGVIKTISTDS